MAVNTTKVPKTTEGIQQKTVNTKGESSPSSRWWLAEPGQHHKDVVSRVDGIEKDQEYRRKQIQRWFRMYDGRNPYGYEFNRFTPPRQAKVEEERITFNVIQAVVDTVTSKIAKNKPHPVFLTEQGRFEQRMRAKNLTRFVRGVFYLNEAYSMGAQVFRTAGAIGTGSWKIFADGTEPRIEYVFPGEVLVDDEEAFYGNPRNRYQVKVVAKDVLVAAFPEFGGLILAAENTGGGAPDRGEYVRVIEAWHLPSTTGGDDGKRVIVIDGVDLAEEKWTRDYFPFEDFHWSAPLIGFWGRGLGEELEGIQVEINRLLIKIQQSHRMFALPLLLSHKNAKIAEKKLSNAIGQIIEWQGNIPPSVSTHQTVHPEIYQHLERLYQRAFEIAGVSMLSATSQKPAGLESGVALREYSDIETERFMTVGQAYEDFFMRSGRQVIDVMDEIEEKLGKGEIKGEMLTVKDASHRALTMINWKDAKMDEAEYTMQVLPVSSLRSSPAGRLQDVMDRVNMGIYSKAVGLQMLDTPDVSAEDNVELAQLQDIEWTIARILEGKKVTPPDAFQNLQLGIERGRAAYLMAKRDDAPEAVMEDLRDWIKVATDALAAAAQPPAPLPGSEQTGATPAGSEPGVSATPPPEAPPTMVS